MKKSYNKPAYSLMPLSVDADYAISCGLSIGAEIIACLRDTMPNEYEELIFAYNLSPSSPLKNDVTFSSSGTCLASCYHGPYDLFFSS